jgi:hypothetical protein
MRARFWGNKWVLSTRTTRLYEYGTMVVRIDRRNVNRRKTRHSMILILRRGDMTKSRTIENIQLYQEARKKKKKEETLD